MQGGELMKAVFIDRHGGPEVLKYGELPDPVPNPGEIVADVHAASVNAADWKVRMCWVATSQAWSARLARASQSSARGCGICRVRCRSRGCVRREDRYQGRHRRQETREPWPCRGCRSGSSRSHRTDCNRGYPSA